MGGLPKLHYPSTTFTPPRFTVAGFWSKPSAGVPDPPVISGVIGRLRDRGYGKETGRLRWPGSPVLDTAISDRNFGKLSTAISSRVYRRFGQGFTAISGRIYRHFGQGLWREYRHFGQGLPPFRAAFKTLNRCFAGSFCGVLLVSAIALVPACLFIAIGESTDRVVGEVGA